MTKADKKDEVMKEQLETEALMDAEVEAATDCGPVSHKVEKKEKEKAEQAETEALMDAEVEAATLRMRLRLQQKIIVPSQPTLRIPSECCLYMSSLG